MNTTPKKPPKTHPWRAGFGIRAVCGTCGITFARQARLFRFNHAFCSASCAGTANAKRRWALEKVTA